MAALLPPFQAVAPYAPIAFIGGCLTFGSLYVALRLTVRTGG